MMNSSERRRERIQSDSDSENDNHVAPLDLPKIRRDDAAAEKKPVVKGGALWQEIAVSQSLEESMEQGLHMPRSLSSSSSSLPQSRKRPAEEDKQTMRFAKRMKQVACDFSLPSLKDVLVRSPRDVAMYRSKWGEALRRNKRVRFFTTGEAVDLPALAITPDPEDFDLLAKEVAWNIGEEKIDVVYRLVETFGIEAIMQIYDNLRDIEANGGMKTLDQRRRRTTGGAFMQLVKEWVPDTLKSKLRAIMREDEKVMKKVCDEKKSRMRNRPYKSDVPDPRKKPRDPLPPLPTRVELMLKEKDNREDGEIKNDGENSIEAVAVEHQSEKNLKEPVEGEDADEHFVDLGINIAEEFDF